MDSAIGIYTTCHEPGMAAQVEPPFIPLEVTPARGGANRPRPGILAAGIPPPAPRQRGLVREIFPQNALTAQFAEFVE